jgi:IS30 family transposase
LAHLVAEKLKLQWSPEQIAGWLKSAYPGDEDFHVSHETIYRTLFIQARGALKKERGGPAQLDRFSVFLSDISAGF